MALFVLVLCGLFLLVCMACFWVYLAPSDHWENRWSSSPDWSPDGGQIAFRCHYPTLPQMWADASHDWLEGGLLHNWGYIPQATEICTIHADGSGFARLTHDEIADGEPVWSPDGQFIAYTSGESLWGDNAVKIIRADGQQPQRLSNHLDIVYWRMPVWSPDSKQVCFEAENVQQPDQGYNFYCTTLASGETRAVTTLAGDEVNVRGSPDGTRIATVWFPEGIEKSVATVKVINLKQDSDFAVGDLAYIRDLSWSPDGTMLTFWGVASSDCPYMCREIYVVNVADRSITCLTEQYEIDVAGEPIWSPDGTRIAFITHDVAIYAMAPDGSALTRIIPNDPESDRHSLAWSPDGDSIAFVRGWPGDRFRIWIAEVEVSGKLRELPTP